MHWTVGHLNTIDGLNAGGFYKDGSGDQQALVVNMDLKVRGYKVRGYSRHAHASKTRPASRSCDDSWSNSAGGAWETGKNWSTGKPPTGSQVACVAIGVRAPVVVNGSTAVGGLVLGGGGGTDELLFRNGPTFTINGSSTIASNGLVTNPNSGLKIVQTGTLTNRGVIEPASGSPEFVGNLLNARGGRIDVASGASFFFDGPGTFTNDGELSVALGSNFGAPHSGGSSATVVNEGTIRNETKSYDGTLEIDQGGMLKETTGAVVGRAVIVNSCVLRLAGRGPSRFQLEGTSEFSGTWPRIKRFSWTRAP